MKFTINKQDLEYQEFNENYKSQPAILSVSFKSNNKEWNKDHELSFILEEWFYDIHGNEVKATSILLSKANANDKIFKNLFYKDFNYQIDIHSKKAIEKMKVVITKYLKSHGHTIKFVGI